MSRSGRAHCVRWVAQLYQKTSLILYRWVVLARSTGCQKPSLVLSRQARATGLSENFVSFGGVSDSLAWKCISDSESLTLEGFCPWSFHPCFGLTASVLRVLSFTVVSGRQRLTTRPPETNHSVILASDQ